MCVVSSKSAVVSNTGILVVPLPNGRQLTVYGNRVSTASEGAMILPVPRGTNPIELVDLSAYPDMFEKLNKTRFLSRGGLMFFKNGSRQIEVVDVGSYRVSIVDDFDQFPRLNRDEFRLTNDLMAFMARFYSLNFSFIICKLRAGVDTTYHPFGYRHDQVNGKMFIPTMHYHLDDSEHVHVDWDHSIYLWNGQMSPEPNLNRFREPCQHSDEYIRKLQTELGLPACHKLLQFKIRDYHENHDLVAVYESPPPPPQTSAHMDEDSVEEVPIGGGLFPAADEQPRGCVAADGRSILPDYVLRGRVLCDGKTCKTRTTLKYGWHNRDLDYCLECFNGVANKSSFVLFRPKFA